MSKERAREQAKADVEYIQELIEELNNARGGDYDEVQTEIYEYPLAIATRSGWNSPGQTSAEEYRIELCTGGPAVQIRGKLGTRYNEPETADVLYQDWFTEWERLPLSRKERADVLEFAQQFYYGE